MSYQKIKFNGKPIHEMEKDELIHALEWSLYRINELQAQPKYFQPIPKKNFFNWLFG